MTKLIANAGFGAAKVRRGARPQISIGRVSLLASTALVGAGMWASPAAAQSVPLALCFTGDVGPTDCSGGGGGGTSTPAPTPPPSPTPSPTPTDIFAGTTATVANVTSGAVNPVLAGGTIDAAATGAITVPLSVKPEGGGISTATGATLTISGTISDSTAGTGGAIVKTGAGTLTLSGPNTYSGGTFVNGGTLRLGTTNAAGSGAIHLVDPTIEFAAAGTYANNIVLEVATPASADPTILRNTSGGAITISGSITTGAGTNIDGFVIDPDQPVIFDGAGTTTLSNTDNSWTGVTTINAGTTLIGSSATISGGSIVDNGALTYNGPGTVAQAISGSGDVTIATGFNGSTVTLTGINSWTGTTTITSGVLSGTASSISGSNIVVNSASNGLSYTGTSAGTVAQNISGSGGIDITASGALTFTGDITTAKKLVLNSSNSNVTIAGTRSGGTELAVLINSTLNVAATGKILGGDYVAVNFFNTSTITNLGTISTTGTSMAGLILPPASSGGSAIVTQNTGVITNGSATNATASISGVTNGIFASTVGSATLTVNNFGSIAGTTGNGIDIEDSTFVLNNKSGGTITGGTNAIALNANDSATLNLNAGSTVAGGIVSTNSGARTVTLAGALTGNYVGGTGTGIVTWTLGATGAMQGATFGSAGDTFNWQGGTIGGVINAGSGTDTFNSVLGAGNTGSVSLSNLTGFETYNHVSGTLTLTGSRLSGSGWAVTSGASVTLAGALTVTTGTGTAFTINGNTSGSVIQVLAGGSISGFSGFFFNGAPTSTFNNAGTISVSSIGLQTNGSTAITNTGTLSSSGSVAIFTGFSVASLVNSGLVSGGASSAAISAQFRGMSITNQAGGFITGGTSAILGGSAGQGGLLTITNASGAGIAGSTGIFTTGLAGISLNNSGQVVGRVNAINAGGTGSVTITNNVGGVIATGTLSSAGASYVPGGSGDAIVLANGGTVTNAGTIDGAAAAINSSASLTLTNSGTISGFSAGIILVGGTINNGDATNTAALIRGSAGNSYGITSSGSTMVVNNYGRIDAGLYGVQQASGTMAVNNLGAASIVAGMYGIVSGGGTINVQNAGKVVGSEYAILGAGVNVSNSGTIGTGTVDALGVFTAGGNSAAIGSGGGGSTASVFNSGTLTGNGGAITSNGAIRLTNTGLITTAGATLTDAVYATDAATITNTGSISSAVGSAVRGASGSVVTNGAAGTLTGGSDVTNGAAVRFVADGTFNNYGSATGGGTTTGVLQTGNFATAINLFAGSTTGSITTAGGNDTLTLYNGRVNASALTQSYTDPVTGATGTITVQNAGTLAAAIVGAINLGGGTNTLVLRGTGDGTVPNGSAGTFAISTLTGATTLTKADSGTWTLTGAAAAPGLTINAGVGGAPGSGGTLIFNGTTGLTGAITVNGATIRAATAGAFGTGTITTVDPTIQYGATGTYANNIVLNSADIAGDPTRIQADNGVTATLTGNITEGSAGQPLVFNLAGSTGIVVLTGTNSYTGATTIAGGTLELSGGAALADTTAVTVATGGTLLLDASETIGSLSGSGTVNVLANRLTTGDNSSTTFSGSIVDPSPVAYIGSWSVYDGPNWSTNPPTYTGQDAAALLFGGSASSYRISTAGTGTTTITDTAWYNRYGGNPNFVEAASNYRVDTGAAGYNAQQDTSAYVGDHTGDVPHINYAFTGGLSLGGGLTKSGTGTLTLTGVSTYTGDTIISGGTLALSGTGSITGSTVVDNSVFTIAGHTGGTSIVNLLGSGTVALGANTLTLSNASGTFSGSIGGTGGLTKAGAGTYILTGANSWTGITTISGGTLQGTTATIGGSSIVDNGTLAYNFADTQTSGKAITGTGAVTMSGGGTLVLTSTSNNWSGTTTIDAGSTIQGTNATVSGGSIIDNGVLAYVQAASGTVGKSISGTGVVNISGLTAGNALTFSGTNSVAGGLVVLDTSKIVVSGNSSGTGSRATLNAGGSLDVTATGSLISSTTTAVTASGATIVNSGTIGSSSATGNGIDASGTGSITNSGTIYGSFSGAIAIAGNQTVTNLAGGTLTGNGGANGLNISPTNGTVIVVNSGTIQTTGAVSAVYLSQPNTTLTLTNNNGGLISGSSNGVRGIGTGGLTTIVNNVGGTIKGNAGAGIVLANTLVLTNNGTLTGTTFGVTGVGGSITNTGTISAATGVNSTGLLTVDNSGSITGTGGTAIVANNAFANAITLRAGSSVTGAITLGTGNDTLSIYNGQGTANGGTRAAATFGAINLGTGSNTLALRGGGDGTAANGTAGSFNLSTAANITNLNKLDTGTWTLTGAAASPAATINAGNGTPSGILIFSGTGLTGTINVNGAIIRATSAGAFGTGTINALDPTIQYGATGTYTNNIVLNSGDIVGDPTRIQADNGVTATLTGNITEGSAGQPLIINVAGSTGTITLTGANTYTGPTTVAGGNLIVNGSMLSVISVATGATLSGTGSLGATTIANGGTLTGVQGNTLTMASLGLNSGSTINATFSSPGGAALFGVTGNLTLDGTINVSSTGAFGFGVYRLFNYGGTLTNNGLDVGTVPGDAQRVLVQTSVAGQINIISAPTELLFWDGGNAALYNDGAVNGGAGTWTTTSPNWTDSTGLYNDAMYPQPGFAIFEATGGNVTVDNSAGNVSVTGMQFASDGYTISGDAITLSGPAVIRVGDGTVAGGAFTATISSVLTGNSSLEKTDLGTLILSGANTYTGTTTVTAGTLTLSGGAAILDSGAVVVANGGRLLLDTSETIGSLSGDGSVDVGANSLTLGGDDSSTTFSGIISDLGASGAPTYVGSWAVGDGPNWQTNPTVYSGQDAAALLFGGSASSYSISTISSDPSQINHLAFVDGWGDSTYLNSPASESFKLDSGGPGYNEPYGWPSFSAYVSDHSGPGQYINYAFSSGGPLGGGITKNGTGTLTLTGANTYTGDTVINGGTVALTGTGSIVNTTVVNYAAFDIAGLNNGGTSIVNLLGSGTVSLGVNTLTLSNASGTFSGVIDGSGGLTKNGSGTYVLSGTNTYTGVTSITGGTLALGDGGATGSVAGDIALSNDSLLQINRSGAPTLGNAVSGTGTVELVNSASLTGAITVSGGVVIDSYVTGTLSNVQTAGTAVTLNDGATLNVTNGGTITSTDGASVFAAASGTITNAGTLQGGSDATLGNAIRFGGIAGTTSTFNNYGSALNGSGGAAALFSVDNGNAIINLFAGSSTGDIVLGGGSNYVSLYTGMGTSNTGLVDAATGIQLQNAGTLSAAAVGSINLGGGALILRGNGNGQAANGFGGILQLSTLTNASAIVKLDNGNWTLTGNAASPGVIIQAGQGSPAGMLVFNGSTGLTGSILVNGAIIRAETAGAFGTGTIFAIDPTIQYGATGTYLNDISLSVVTPASVDPTVLAADAGVTATLTGQIYQNGGAGVDPFQPLTISGPGTIVLTNASNSWAGTTTIAAGATLRGTTFSISGGDIVNNGLLNYNGAVGASGSTGQAISGSGALLVNGGATVTLTAANTYTGGTTVDGAGTILQVGGGTTGSILGNVLLSTNGRINFYSTINQTFGNNVSGIGIVGAIGTVQLTGAITVTGGVSVAANSTATLTNVSGSLSNAVNLNGVNAGIFVVPGGSVTTTNGTGVSGGFAGASVLNYGLISGATNNWGITLLAGATNSTITNAYGGTVTGGAGGVLDSANGLQLSNAGAIYGSGGSGIGIRIAGTGANIVNSGVIVGGQRGILATSYATITNAGTIGSGTLTGGVYTADRGARGIDLQAGGFVVNNGLIQGTTSYGLIAFAPSTLVNTGTILSLNAPAGSFTPAVFFTAGGAVTNYASGVIVGNRGVQITGGGTIVNYGQVTGLVDNALSLFGGGNVTNAAGGQLTATGVGGWGIFADSAGTLDNRGAINADSGMVSISSGAVFLNSGTIVAAQTGVWGYATSVNLTNSGSISGGVYGVAVEGGASSSILTTYGATITGGTAGIVVGGNGLNLSNAGLIYGSGATGNGIDITGANANILNSGQIVGGSRGIQSSTFVTITNAGTIVAGTASGGSVAADRGSQAIYLGGGGFIVNNGLILSGTTTALAAYGAPATLTNDGRILSVGPAGSSAAAVLFAAGGAITNYQHGLIIGGRGVQVDTGGTINNFGQIVGWLDNGVLLTAGGTVTNQVDGVILAGGTGGSGLLSNGNLTLTNAGLIATTANGAFDGVTVNGVATVDNTGRISATVGSGLVFNGAGSTVLNRGIIAGGSDVALGYGINVQAGANNSSINNAYGGVLSGLAGGMLVSANNVQLSNAGSIYGSGANGLGLRIDGTGSTLVNSGQIVGGSEGVFATTFATITNAGTIGAGTLTGTAYTADRGGRGIDLRAGGFVINGGLIQGNSNYGLFITGGTGTLANTGTILSGATTGFTPAVYFAAGGSATNYASGVITGRRGIEIDNGGSVANYGQITGTIDNAISLFGGGNVTNFASGVLTANGVGGWGIFANGVGTLDNKGTINADSGMVSTSNGAVFLNSGTIVAAQNGVWGIGTRVNLTNSGSISGGAVGVLGEASGSSIVNSGTISGNVAGALGIYLAGGNGNIINKSGGTISGNGAGAAIYLTGANYVVTLDTGSTVNGLIDASTTTGTNSYTISGALNGGLVAGSGTDLVTLFTGGAVTGTLDGGAGIDTFVADGSGASSIDAGSVINFESRIKNGSGTLTLSGIDGSTADWTINGGILSASGGSSINDLVAVTVNAAGTLNLLNSEAIGSLAGSGGVTLNANTLTTGFNNGSTLFSGVISGSGGLNKVGTGTFTLSGANTYTGATSVFGGTLALGASNVIADASSVFVDTSAILDLGSNSDTVASLYLLGTLNGTGTLTASQYQLQGGTVNANLGTGTLLVTGPGVSLLNGTSAASLVDVISGTLRLGASDRLADSASVLVEAGSVFDIQGFNDTVGALDLQATLDGTGTLTAATYALNGATVNANLGLGTLSQNGGVSTLNGTAGANLVYVNSGTLKLGASDRLANGAIVSVQGGATLDLQGFSDTIGQLALTGTLNGTGTLTATEYDLYGGTANANLGLGNLFQVSGSSVLNGTAGSLNVAILGGTLTLGASDRLADTATVSVASGAALNLGANSDTVGLLMLNGSLNGTGTLTATQYQLTGATVNANLGGGTLFQLGGTSVLNGTVAATAVNINAGTLKLGASDRLADGATVAVASGAVLDLQSYSDTVGLLLLNGTLNGTGTLTATQYQLTGAAVNANLGGGALFQLGGTSVLNGTVAATAVNINAGTLKLGASDRLADGATVAVASGAVLDLQSYSDTVGLLMLNGTLNGSGTLTASQYQLTGATVNANLGAGTLFQMGGTSILNGTALATPVMINGGTLVLGASNRLSDTATVVIANGAVLNLGAFNDTIGLLQANGTLNGTGTLTASQYQLTGATINANLGAGTLFQLGGTSALNGTAGANLVMVNAGTLALGASDRLSDGATVVVANGAILNLGSLGAVQPLGTSEPVDGGQATLAVVASQPGRGDLIGTLGNNAGIANLNTTEPATATLAAFAPVLESQGSQSSLGLSPQAVGDPVNDTIALLQLNGTLNGNGTLTAAQYQLTGATVNANLGTGTLFQLGGTSTLNGTANVGVVAVNSGTLKLGGSNRIADGALVNVATGATFDLANFSDSVATVTGGGTVALGTGTLTVGGTNADFGFGGAFTGTGDLTKTGTGTFTFLGTSTTTARLNANAGNLLFAGTSAGSARVQGGILSGGGTFAGNLLLASGTLSPGMTGQAIAGFNVGSFTASGGIYAVDFAGTTGGFAADQVFATGAVTLTGGTVTPTATAATSTYNVNQEYLILKGASLSGTFGNGSTFGQVAGSPELYWRLRYDLAASGVVLEIRKVVDFSAGLGSGATRNQIAVGTSLNGSVLTGSDAWMGVLNSIGALSPSDRLKTYDSIGGEALADITTSVAAQGNRFTDLLRSRFANGGAMNSGDITAAVATIDGTAPTGAIRAAQPTLAGDPSLAGKGKTGFNAWIQGFGANGTIGASSGTAKVSDFAAGVAVGMELKTDTLTIGAAGAVSDLEGNVRSLNSSNKGTLYQGGVYIAFDDGTNYANVSGSYFSGTINTARTVSVGANIIGKAAGQAKTDGFAGGATVGRRIGLGGNMYFTPQLGADVISVNRDAFIESGAGVLSLSVNSEKRTLYSGLAEGRLSYRGVTASGGVVEPYVSAGVRVNFGNLDTLSSMRFTGAPSGTGGFTIAGARVPKTSALVSAGINANPSDNVSIGVEVGGSFGDKQQEGRVGLHLKIGF